MVKQILEAIGLEENKTYKRTRFLKVPKEDFAVYFDDADARGSDYENLILRHEVRVEFYSYGSACAYEAAFEKELNRLGIPWSRSDRAWLNDGQCFVTMYYFDYQEHLL